MSVCAFNTVQLHKRGQRAAAVVFPSECWCLIFPLFLMWLHGSFLNAKQKKTKKQSATSVSSLMNSCFVSWSPDFENRCRLNKAIKRRMQKGQKKKERKSQQLSRTVRKSMRNLCSPSSRRAASLPSLPYVFIYPVMWVPVHGQPRNFSGTSGSNGERVLSTEAERRELRLRLDVGSRQWNVAAARQQESPQRPFTLMGLNQRCAP